MAIELSKVTVEDVNMNNPADIQDIYAILKTMANAINLLVDKQEEQDASLDDAVYYVE